MYKNKSYLSIVSYYEDCLKKHGDSHLGVDWQNEEDANIRYQVMLDILENNNQKSVSLLDFGCGTSRLLDFIKNNKIKGIDYAGLDLSSEFISVCKKKYPAIDYFNVDILEAQTFPSFDYIVMNGIFTEKLQIFHEEMFEYFCSMIKVVFNCCRKGMAFNLRSKQVEREDQELFHLSLDQLALFLVKEFGRRFVIRNDYGLEEYTVYLYS